MFVSSLPPALLRAWACLVPLCHPEGIRKRLSDRTAERQCAQAYDCQVLLTFFSLPLIFLNCVQYVVCFGGHGVLIPCDKNVLTNYEINTVHK